MYKQIEFTIKSVSPLIQHNARLANPLDPISKALKKVSSKRSKTDEDHALLARLEWLGGLYTTEPGTFEPMGEDLKVQGFGRVCIPGENIESMLVMSGKKQKLGQQCKAGIISDGLWLLEYDGPQDVPGLLADGRFMDIQSARVQNAKVMRSRPIFYSWQLTFVINYLPELLDEAQVVEVLTRAGRIIGLCDQRPKYGRFEVVYS